MATARGEIILAASSIGSVQILQRSGIGRLDWLREAGIKVRHARPGVGADLQDHLQLRLAYKVHGLRTLNETYAFLWPRCWIGCSTVAPGAGP